MSIKYKFNEYTIAYGHEYVIDAPIFNDITTNFSLYDFNDIFKINEDGSILITSDVNIGIYDLIILTKNDKINIKIIIKPNITYKIVSFYNNNEYNTYLPITNPINLIGEYKLEQQYDNININNQTGEISFNENITAGIYNLIINCIVKNIEQICITTFNIYPLLKYKYEEYYCEKWDIFKTDIPYKKPFGGNFNFSNNYPGILIDNITGQISIDKPKSGCYKLTIIYKINNISTNTNILLYIKPIITYNNYGSPTNTDPGGLYELEQTNFNKNLLINSSNGDITIKNAVDTGLYFIKVFYSYNNYTTETISEISIIPNIFYINNKIDIIFGTKYQSEKPQSNEEINGLFSLIKIYENIHINPNNGILYISNNLECNNYCIDINYNKNNINKIIQFYIKVIPFIEIKNNEKQEINYYENLNDIIIETNPKSGILTNNLNIPIKNNIIKITEFEKKIGNYELKIKYNFNNLFNVVIYNFSILPYIIYNLNNINIIYKQTYISETPTVYPYDGIFILETKTNNINIDEKTGKINISSGLAVGFYNLVVKYKSCNLINKTEFKITIKPLINLKKNIFIYKHNALAIDDNYDLESIDVYPKEGIFSIDKFFIDKNGIITIPSKINVGEYKLNIKYTYSNIDTDFEYLIHVIPFKLNCLFKQCEKIYDGTNNVNVKYILNNNIKLSLTYDATFENKNVGFNKKIEIKNIQILDNINIIHDDTFIFGIIKPKKLIIKFIGIDKYYNGINDAQVEYTIENIIEGDDVYIKYYDCFYESIIVSNSKISITNIILDGKDSKNYYTDLNYETFGKIKPKKAFIIFNSPIINYTGSSNINLEIASIEDLCNNEKVIIESYTANFESVNVGENIPIIVNNIKAFYNYNYIFLSKPLFGTINKKELILNATATNKVYDGTTKAIINFNDPNINIISFDANYENKNVGSKKKIYINNIICDNPNYDLKDIIIVGSILPLTLIVKYYGDNKVYDGTCNTTGTFEILNKIEKDDIEIKTTITFKNSNVIDYNKDLNYTIPTLIGIDSTNYKIKSIILNKPCIFKKKIVIDFIGINKIYDNTTKANIKININDKNIKIK